MVALFGVLAFLSGCMTEPLSTSADGDGALVAAIEISPASVTLPVGETVQFTAEVKDAAGNTLNGHAVDWVSSNASVAAVDQDGLVTAVAAGSASITATADGKSDSAPVTVVSGGSSGGQGKITVDPNNPSWLIYENGDPFFLVGAGGPEYFLYDGTKQGDGTRTGGRQQQIIDAAIEHGWNGIYMIVDATGDGLSGDHPWLKYSDPGGSDKWNQNIIDQWHGWFQQMDDAGIAIVLFLYDDGTDPFGSHNAAERDFVDDLANELKGYNHLVWVIAEEYSEALTAQRSRDIAARIRAIDAVHPIANHQLTGVTFDFANDDDFDQFAMQLQAGSGDVDPEGIHADVVTAWNNAAGRYNLNASELQPDHGQDGEDARTRRVTWAAITGGAYVMILRWWEDRRSDGNPTPSDAEQRQAGYAQAFMAGTRFHRMAPDDSRAFGETEWVLVEGNTAFVGYSRNAPNNLGFTAMTSGDYDLTWLDAVSGDRLDQVVTGVSGNTTFARPSGIPGDEVALYARRRGDTSGGATVLSVEGGEFTGTGWKSVSASNKIVVDLGEFMPSGELEFQVRGLKTGLTGGSNGKNIMVALWNLSSGQNCDDPCDAAFMQIRFHTAGASHPDGSVMFRLTSRNTNSGSSGSHEGVVSGITWDPDRWYTLTAEWTQDMGPGSQLLLDGSVVNSGQQPNPVVNGGLRYLFIGDDNYKPQYEAVREIEFRNVTVRRSNGDPLWSHDLVSPP